jgi:hypothetical protein
MFEVLRSYDNNNGLKAFVAEFVSLDEAILFYEEASDSNLTVFEVEDEFMVQAWPEVV